VRPAPEELRRHNPVGYCFYIDEVCMRRRRYDPDARLAETMITGCVSPDSKCSLCLTVCMITEHMPVADRQELRRLRYPASRRRVRRKRLARAGLNMPARCGGDKSCAQHAAGDLAGAWRKVASGVGRSGVAEESGCGGHRPQEPPSLRPRAQEMPETSAVSAILPVYNGERYVAAAVRSVLPGVL
jgi:hypothetical protein